MTPTLRASGSLGRMKTSLTLRQASAFVEQQQLLARAWMLQGDGPSLNFPNRPLSAMELPAPCITTEFHLLQGPINVELATLWFGQPEIHAVTQVILQNASPTSTWDYSADQVYRALFGDAYQSEMARLINLTADVASPGTDPEPHIELLYVLDRT